MGFSAPQARNFWGYGVYSYDFLGSIITFFALHYPYRTPPGVGGVPPETKKIKASFHVFKKISTLWGIALKSRQLLPPPKPPSFAVILGIII